MPSSGERFAAGAREILGGRHDPQIYDDVARVLVAALAESPTGTLGLHAEEWAELLRILVLQEQVAVGPPILHTLIANYQSGGSPQVLANAGEVMGLQLGEMLAPGDPPKNLVLMVLLLRDHISTHVDQETISRHHRATVASFDLQDLSLPYSNAFTDNYDRNCADIGALLADRLRGGSETNRLPLPHVIVFEWLTGLGALTSPVELADRMTSHSAAGPTTAEENLAAARTLLVRHTTSPDELISHDLPEEVLSAELVDAARHITESRTSLPPAADDPAKAAIARLEDRRRQAVHAGIGLVSGRLGIPSRRRPRVAVCLSGQLRGYERVFETWRRTLLRVADCELFVHTWSKVGRSGAEGFRATLPFAGTAFTAAYRDVALRHGFDEVKLLYPALFEELSASGTITADQLRDHYDTPHVVVEDDEGPPYEGWTNQQKMHAKIEKAFEMVEAADWEPDLVVRLRPDKPIHLTAFSWRDLLAACERSATLFADSARGVHYAQLVIGDQFAIGSPSTMAVYSRTWSTYPLLARAGLLACPEELSGHSSLAQVCWTHGIDVRRAPLKFGDLQEAEPLGSSDIERCLRVDSEGRDHPSDQELLRAVRADLARG